MSTCIGNKRCDHTLHKGFCRWPWPDTRTVALGQTKDQSGRVSWIGQQMQKNRWAYSDTLLQTLSKQRVICGSWTQCNSFGISYSSMNFFSMVLPSKILTWTWTHITHQHPVSSDKALQSLTTQWMKDPHLSLLQTLPSWFHVVPLWWMDDKQFFPYLVHHTFDFISSFHFFFFWMDCPTLIILCIDTSPDLWQYLFPSLYLLQFCYVFFLGKGNKDCAKVLAHYRLIMAK